MRSNEAGAAGQATGRRSAARRSSSPRPAWSARPRPARPGRHSRRRAAGARAGKANGQFRANAYGLATDKAGERLRRGHRQLPRSRCSRRAGAFKRKHRVHDTDESVKDVAVGPDGSVVGHGPAGGRGAEASAARRRPSRRRSRRSAIAVDAEGNVYVATAGDNIASASSATRRLRRIREGRRRSAASAIRATSRASPDGSVYVVDGLNVKRFVDDRARRRRSRAARRRPLGIGVDLDCNLWMTNISQRQPDEGLADGQGARHRHRRRSDRAGRRGRAEGRPLRVRRRASTRSSASPRTARSRRRPRSAAASRCRAGMAKLKYTLSGVACPAQVSATASLSGAVNGKASVKVAAGKSTVLTIPVKGTSGDGAVQDRAEDERPSDDADGLGQRDREVARSTVHCLRGRRAGGPESWGLPRQPSAATASLALACTCGASSCAASSRSPTPSR